MVKLTKEVREERERILKALPHKFIVGAETYNKSYNDLLDKVKDIINDQRNINE